MKTRSILLGALALFIGISFTSCEKIKGKGDTVTEARGVSGYSGISLAVSATVYYSQGPDYSLEIQGQQNVLERIITQVEGNNLVIKLKKGINLGSHDPIRVYITDPGVNTLDISGSGDIYVDSPWIGSDLSANISGSGSITVSMIEADRFNANISGSGNIKAMSGTSGREDLKISGSGNIEMQYVVAEDVYTKTSGSGDTYVQATKLLEVTISGSGNIYYLGNPIINTHISGSGNIRRL
ncbi:MAG: DUF2807 domain-containing protein [Bacteroidales bacterium]|nr:DUF2807 domain-containing protein [Bacteroidales bacterium]